MLASEPSPSPLKLSNKRIEKYSQFTSNNSLYAHSDDNYYDSVEETPNTVKKEESIISRIRKMFDKQKKKNITTRLSNDCIAGNTKDYQEQSVFYKESDENNYKNYKEMYENLGDNGYDEDDEFHEDDEFILDMSEDVGPKEGNAEKNIKEGLNEENENDEDNFGILGILEKNSMVK